MQPLCFELESTQPAHPTNTGAFVISSCFSVLVHSFLISWNLCDSSPFRICSGYCLLNVIASLSVWLVVLPVTNGCCLASSACEVRSTVLVFLIIATVSFHFLLTYHPSFADYWLFKMKFNHRPWFELLSRKTIIQIFLTWRSIFSPLPRSNSLIPVKSLLTMIHFNSWDCITICFQVYVTFCVQSCKQRLCLLRKRRLAR